ncbi:hypothetical protein GW931_00495 [archaeon]|nr:hypothetical protein [archaeon]
MITKRGQVWIETVTYTLVAFVLIGLVLGFAKPKIQEMQDQAIIEQSMKMIKEIDSVIQEISEKGIGNKRKIELSLKKGEMEINSINDTIAFTLEGRFMYSQPGQEYEEGNIAVLTEERGDTYTVTLKRDYSGLYNITYTDKEEIKKIQKGTTPYNIYITNKGGENNTINFQID